MGGNGGAELYLNLLKPFVPALVGGHCFLTAALVLPGLASSSYVLFCGIGSSAGLCSQVFLTYDPDCYR